MWDPISGQGWVGLPWDNRLEGVSAWGVRVKKSSCLLRLLVAEIKEVVPRSGRSSPSTCQRLQQRTKRGEVGHVRCFCIDP
jgi:hypothetical protein